MWTTNPISVVIFSVFLSSSCLLPPSASANLDIGQVLGQYPELSSFSNYLAQTQLVHEINRRQPITVLALSNSDIGPLTGKPMKVLKKILSVHVLLDYYDPTTFKALAGQEEVSVNSLLGVARNEQQGLVNISVFPAGGIFFSSASPGSPPLTAFLLKPVILKPFNLSVLQISNPIIPTNNSTIKRRLRRRKLSSSDSTNTSTSSSLSSSSSFKRKLTTITTTTSSSPAPAPENKSKTKDAAPAPASKTTPAPAPAPAPSNTTQPKNTPTPSPSKAPESSSNHSHTPAPTPSPSSSPKTGPVLAPANHQSPTPTGAPASKPGNPPTGVAPVPDKKSPGPSVTSSPAESPLSTPPAANDPAVDGGTTPSSGNKAYASSGILIASLLFIISTIVARVI